VNRGPALRSSKSSSGLNTPTRQPLIRAPGWLAVLRVFCGCLRDFATSSVSLCRLPW